MAKLPLPSFKRIGLGAVRSSATTSKSPSPSESTSVTLLHLLTLTACRGNPVTKCPSPWLIQASATGSSTISRDQALRTVLMSERTRPQSILTEKLDQAIDLELSFAAAYFTPQRVWGQPVPMR